MIALLGNLALCAALASGLAGVACSVLGRRAGDWLWRARAAIVAAAACLLLAGAALMTALVSGDMRFAYVAAHTDLALPLHFRIAAFWSGQEGSLLLWAVLLGAMSAAAVKTRRHESDRAESVTLGTLSLVISFFAALLFLAANPFHAGTHTGDGSGLNPLLQHPAMVMHPPVLFSGYAAFTIPFAIALGALFAGREGDAWVAGARRWALGAWMLIGAGIVLGAWWAYVELGWGGYWAWDPVENASLLPWLTGAALVHTLGVHERRGMLRAWTGALAPLTFFLCITGTYLTRSGVIQSVHAFGQSPVGDFFVWFLAAGVPLTVAAIVLRRAALRSSGAVERFLSREGLVLTANVLLVLMAAATLVGTIFPILSGALGFTPVAVGPSFYNRVVVPMGVGCAVLMALGPMLGSATAARALIRRELAIPTIAGTLAVVGAMLIGMRHPVALVCAAAGAFTLVSLAIATGRAVVGRSRAHGTPLLVAAARLIDDNHRRHGGHLAHAGFAVAILGIAGSSLLSVSETGTLRTGESLRVGRYSLRLDGMRQVEGPNYSAVEAEVVATPDGGSAFTLRPQRRFHQNAMDPTSEIAISSGWREDVYVALVGWESGGKIGVIQAHVNPMVSWIWAGAIAMTAGAALALLPRLASLLAAWRARRAGLAIRPSGASAVTGAH